MNASFRTAFWAMCLGLTVPMVLFVGVEMTSGGRSARKTGMAAHLGRGSLRDHWKTTGDKIADRKPRSNPSRNADQSRKRTVTKRPSAAPSEPRIVLGPQLETDPTASEPGSVRDRRLFVRATADRPRIEVLPEPELNAAMNPADSREIESRLASIQQNLDRLESAIAAQSERQPPVDAVQTAELLKLLREARDAERSRALPALQSDDENRQPRTEDLHAKPRKTARDYDTDVADLERPAKREPQPETKIYHPRYLSGNALQALVVPLLTKEIGKVGATDAGTDESALAGGGDAAPAAVSVVVVRDFPEVLRKIDRLVQELDIPPLQVKIEATVVTLRLDEGRPHGIDLRELNAAGRPFAITPPDSSVAPGEAPSSAADPSQLTHGFGLKCGVLRGDPRAFINTLQSIVQMRRANAWQISVLNRQSAELVVSELGAVNAGATGAESGTVLKVRPDVTSDGVVHLDVRRDNEHDTGGAGNRSGALSHRFALRDGQTAVVGGFFAEQLSAYMYSKPGLGRLPFVGRHFRKQVEMVDRSETIVLLTPHVIHPVADLPGVAHRRDRSRSLPKGRPILKETTATSRFFGRKTDPLPSSAPLSTKPEARSVEHETAESTRSKPARRAPGVRSAAAVPSPDVVDRMADGSESEPVAESRTPRRVSRGPRDAQPIPLPAEEILLPGLPESEPSAIGKPSGDLRLAAEEISAADDSDRDESEIETETIPVLELPSFPETGPVQKP